MRLMGRGAGSRALCKAVAALAAILLCGGLVCACAAGTSGASGASGGQDGGNPQGGSGASGVAEERTSSEAGMRLSAEMERKASVILDDLKSRGLHENAEGLSALEVANRDERELRISYVWTGDEGTRWCVYVVDEGVFATPVGHGGSYVNGDYVFGEGAEPSAFVETGTGSTDFTLVDMPRIDAESLNEWAHENEEALTRSAGGTLEEAEANDAENGGRADGARAPAGDEGEDEN